MRFLLSALFLFSINVSNAQTSIANGNWTMPFTWDCTCVPLPGATVTVAHSVVLNTDWATSNGSITINNGASLLQDNVGRDIQVSGGFITNNGTFDLRFIYLQTGTVTNNGDMTVASFSNFGTFGNTGDISGVDSLYTDGSLTNSGTMEVATFFNADQFDNQGSVFNVDSMFNAGTFTNAVGASVDADSAMNAGTLVNNGVFTHGAMTNSGTFTNNNYIGLQYFTNTGTFHNFDSIMATGSMTNAGTFTNHEDAVMEFGASFLNADIISNNASFENNGFLDLGGSWYNFDSFSGNVNGRVQVQDTSSNVGSMTGSFDLCDLTPNTIVPSQTPTGLDYNVGTVGNTITWCLITGVSEAAQNVFQIYPNPANEILYIKGIKGMEQVELIDLQGRVVISIVAPRQLELTDVPDGVYLLQINSEDKLVQHQVVVAH